VGWRIGGHRQRKTGRRWRPTTSVKTRPPIRLIALFPFHVVVAFLIRSVRRMGVCKKRWSPFGAIVMRAHRIMKMCEGLKDRVVPSGGIFKILTSDTFRYMRERIQSRNQVICCAVESCHSRCLQRINDQVPLMVWQFDNHAAPCQFLDRV
jgi:hypothetical protein